MGKTPGLQSVRNATCQAFEHGSSTTRAAPLRPGLLAGQNSSSAELSKYTYAMCQAIEITGAVAVRLAKQPDRLDGACTGIRRGVLAGQNSRSAGIKAWTWSSASGAVAVKFAKQPKSLGCWQGRTPGLQR
jgi:hypothetical protein